MSGLGRFRPSCQRIVRFSVDGVSLRLSSKYRPSPSSTSAVTRGSPRPTALRQGADMEVSFSRFDLGHFSTRRTSSVFSASWRTLEDGFRLGSNGWTGSSPYSSANVPGGDDNQGPVAVDDSSPMEEEHFHELADDVLHHLQDNIEVYGEDLNVDGFDLDYSSGVLTVRLGDLGTYVMNKQTPNRQIWLSSPVSGPGRFDWSTSKSSWIYKRKDVELVSLLEKEFGELLGTSIDLS